MHALLNPYSILRQTITVYNRSFLNPFLAVLIYTFLRDGNYTFTGSRFKFSASEKPFGLNVGMHGNLFSTYICIGRTSKR